MARSDVNPPVASDLTWDQTEDQVVESAVIDNKDTEVSDVAVVGGEALDTAALPKGTVDPVYEAKARVLNNAVRN